LNLHSRRLVLAWLFAVIALLVSITPRARSEEGQSYEGEQVPPGINPEVRSLREYQNQSDPLLRLGMKLREARCELKHGKDVKGLLIVQITPGSPAANAGLHAYRQTTRIILEGAVVIAAVVFPPALFAIPIFATIPLGETSDLIIAVDASRVKNFNDFEDQMHDVEPGEIVYLTVVRDGSRRQVPVMVPLFLN
jgi:S1-C subfamily serine protease